MLSAPAIAERLREASAARQRLRIVGAGTWLDAGRPVDAVQTLSLSEHHGIVEYVPGDLTLTARAGTRLSDITAATAANGQWLPLAPWGGDDGTLGATVSTATAGPHAAALGQPRDVVLGLEFVTGDGHVVRAGGRVVKNVAGFDLTRLLVGSWGTLGVITEVSVRLRALPEQTRTVGVAVDTSHATLNELAGTLRALPFVPLAAELLDTTASVQLGIGDRALLLVKLGGNEKSVKGQLEALSVLGDRKDVEPSVWETLRSMEPAAAAVWRWSRLPSVFGETWNAADRATRQLKGGALMHGNPARGVVRVLAATNAGVSAAELTRAAIELQAIGRGTVAIERLPRDAWPLLEPTIAQDALSRALRDKYDPARVLNTGILGGDT
ncbi:MAG TPA: FAD-binding protein [Gemmatimonadaceae bacterium]|nr:FAD-binding protein [Gemmatimonadaceae bacterium]